MVDHHLNIYPQQVVSKPMDRVKLFIQKDNIMAIPGINITGGVFITGGVTIDASGGGGGGVSGTVTFSEFYDGSQNQTSILQDTSGSLTGTGFIINNGSPHNSGVALTMLSPNNISFFANSPDNSGFVWTVNWAAGSTYASTPVAMYYNQFGNGTYAVFYILDPADNTYQNSVSSGTFNFPATFVSGTTPV